MGAFTFMITNKGKALQAKAQTGAELRYTRFRVGDGQLGGRPISDLTGLINPVLTLPVLKLQTRPGGRAVVGTVLSNQNVTTGFYLREIGIFAQDPDVGEILYCYGNAGETADYIPAKGGSNIIEEPIDISTIVGNASNVTAGIDESLVWASHDDVEKSLADSKEYTDQKVKDIDLSKITPDSIGAAKKEDLSAHVQDNKRHVTEDERNNWNSKAPGTHKHDAGDITSGTMASDRLPGASISTAGIVQLSTATNGTRANVAATESAVKAAYDRANEAFQSGVEWRGRIAGAINAKGVPASGNDEWGTLEWKISQITTGVPIARVRTNVSAGVKNFLISEGDTTTWGLYYIVVTGLSFQAKGIVVFGENFYSLAAFDFYTNPRISVSGASYNHQVVYRDTLPPQQEWSILATVTPNSFVVPVSRYESDSNKPASVIVYG
ncbi:tail fiber protein [Paenibacillus alvei]|uniref:tail fiber protein n=1 Tax=Paenibacillus alvei TaxID=44250 RepID=UPI00227EA55B|nr:tail fiber protein [Paenibacillus alvei]MCY7485823.1 tail fiber protein [Paenibacillus alvei]